MKGAKILLVVSAAFALLIGLAMLASAKSFLEPQGITVDDHVAGIAHAQASLLLGIGATNLLMLRVNDAKALQMVMAGNIVTHVAGLGVNIHALSANLVTQQVYGDVVGHVVFAALFAFFIMRVGRAAQ